MNTAKYDFRAWLNTKPDDEKYEYMDICGSCAVGQFMAFRGEAWNFPRYSELAKEICDGEFGQEPLARSKTFGELKKALEPVGDEA